MQGLAEAELEQLETQGARTTQVELDSDPTDNSDDDYQSLHTYHSSRLHDREASGSGSATNPALVSILSRLTRTRSGQSDTVNRTDRRLSLLLHRCRLARMSSRGRFLSYRDSSSRASSST
jgi:hypothetical protein